MKRSLNFEPLYYLHRELAEDTLALCLKSVLRRFINNPDTIHFYLRCQVGSIYCENNNVTYEDLNGLNESQLTAWGSILSARFTVGRNKEIFFSIGGYGGRIKMGIKTYDLKIDQQLSDAFFREFDLRQTPKIKEKSETISNPPQKKNSTNSINTARVNLVTLKNVIYNHSDLDEISDLCFELGVNFEDLGGSNKRKTKAKALVEFMKRKQHLGELIVQIGKEHPELKWAEIIQ